MTAIETNGTVEATPIAGFWRRVMAFILDSLLLGIVGTVLGFMLFDVFARMGGAGRLIGFTIALVYFGVMNSRIGGGQTFGKIAMKVKVVGRDGAPISPPASFGRAAIFCVPYFLNGAPFDVQWLMSWIGAVLSLLTVGVGLALVYLFIFNRQTRQSVHDLAVGSFVVKADMAPAPMSPLPFWRGHLVSLALIGGLTGALPVLTGQIAQSDTFGPLFALQKTLLGEPGVLNAGVHVNKTLHYGSDNTRIDTNSLQLQVYLRSDDVDDDALANRIAQLALEADVNAAGKDLIEVTIAYGYDIGIASGWRSQNHAYAPEEWRRRQTATPGARPLQKP